MVTRILILFEGEKTQTKCNVLGYRIDLYFHDYKLAIDPKENWHSDRSMVWEIERQKAIEQGFVCKFIIIYPDKEDFGIFKTIS